jgi:hypothetical protein
MANIPIYSGSSDFVAYLIAYNANPTLPPPTAFGFYNNDIDFQTDADKITVFCARRLGWPIENVELQDLNFILLLKKQQQFMETSYMPIKLEKICSIWKVYLLPPQY